ncbi:MAG: GEVED domain-containing protein [Crocinitomicaceae bacterium]
MKIFLLTLMLLIVGFGVSAQVSIGSGATGLTNQAIPVECYYGYTYSQMIYTATEINASGTITSLKFYKSGTGLANSSDWTVYLGEVSNSTFASGTAWEPVANLTQVFSDSVVQVGNEVTITLTTPFVYGGVLNLMIAVDENEPSYDGSGDDFYCSARAGVTALSYRSDPTNPDPASPPSATFQRSAVANVEIGGITQTCPTLSGLTANNITASTADLDWLAGTGSDYEVEYGTSGFALGTGTNSTVTVDSLNITGLTAVTNYEFYVRNICGAGDTSAWAGPFSFATPCANYTPNYTEDFSTFLPACWEEAQGVLGATNTTFSSTTSSSWVQDGFGNVGTTGAARMEIYSTGRDEWLISPSIDLGTGATPYQLEFDVALTTWNNTNADVLGTDDTLAVVISTDNGVTWSNTNILQLYTTGSEPSATGDFTVVPLTGYTGVVKFGFYAASSVSGGDINVYIDNFKVRDVPNCPQPTLVATDSTTTTIAYLSWALGATNSVIEFGPAGFAQGSGTMVSVMNGVDSIVGLMPATTYDFYIKDSCNTIDTSPWTGPVSFTTGCAPFIAPYTESFDVAGLPTCFSNYANSGGPWVFSTGSGVNTSCGPQTEHTGNGGYFAWMDQSSTDDSVVLEMYDVDVSALTTAYLEFYYSECGNATAPNFLYVEAWDGSVWNNVTTINQATSGWELFGFDISTHVYNTSLVKIRFRAESGGASNDYFADNVLDDISIYEMPTCFIPTALSGSPVSFTTADLMWTASTGETEWAIEWGPTGFSPGTGTLVPSTTTNPHTLTGLTANTNYDFYVRGICGVADSSNWAGPSSFYTGYCTPAPTSVDGSGITNVTLGTINNTTGGEAGNYGNYDTLSTDVIQGASAQAFSIEYSTGYTYGTKIWVDWNDNLVFEASEEVYTGLSASANPTVLSGTFAIPATAALGSHTMRIGGTDNNNGPDPCYAGSYGSLEDYTVNVIAPCYVAATDVQVACDTYTWTDGMMYTADNNSAIDTLKSNVAGICDTIFTLDLTVNSSTTGTDVQTACDTYTWIDGATYTASNTTATHVLTNAAGCDSTVTLDLTINNTATGTDVQVACDTYTWIDGMTYTASNNSATFTLTAGAVNGCDSVVTLDLTINSSNTGVAAVSACDSYTWIDGMTYTSSGTAMHTLTNAAGCDSVVTLLLTISQPSSGTSTITACGSYTWIDGITYTASNNTATYTLNNSNGCDSLIALDLTINMPTTNTISATECDSYTSDAGNTYTSTGMYTETFTGANGCDSVLTLDLTITNAINTVSLANNIFLTSNQPGATYQWLDCDNGNAPIAGATDQVYVATTNGDYACEVTFQTCTVTSTCITVSTVGIDGTEASFASVYPNPVNNLLTITLSDLDNAQVELLDMQGKVVIAPANIASGQQVDVSNLESGVYFVRLTSDDHTMIKRVVKN